MTKLLEKHNVDVQRVTTKYEHTHRTFVEAFNKELPKHLFKPMYAQELQDHEKVSTIWVKKLNSIVNKMFNAKPLMIGMKPKDSIKLDIGELDKSESYPEKEVSAEDSLYRYLYQSGEQHGDKKMQATDFTWNKSRHRLDWIVEQPGNHDLYYFQDGLDRAFVCYELMHIPKNTRKYLLSWQISGIKHK